MFFLSAALLAMFPPGVCPEQRGQRGDLAAHHAAWGKIEKSSLCPAVGPPTPINIGRLAGGRGQRFHPAAPV